MYKSITSSCFISNVINEFHALSDNFFTDLYNILTSLAKIESIAVDGCKSNFQNISSVLVILLDYRLISNVQERIISQVIFIGKNIRRNTGKSLIFSEFAEVSNPVTCSDPVGQINFRFYSQVVSLRGSPPFLSACIFLHHSDIQDKNYTL